VSDAIIVGAGPNGLIAANLLADRGWSVLVLEEQDEPGGAVKSGELTLAGHVHDLFSAFYPFAAASRVIDGLDLEEYGLRWRHAESVVAHPRENGRCAVLSRDLDRTVASLDADAPGDGEAWRRLFEIWETAGEPLIEALHTPFPPIRPALAMARALGPAETARFMRMATSSVRRLAEETFAGEGGPDLLAGNALHADLTPDAAAGGLFGWLLCSLGQRVGFPVVSGGAGNLTAALVRRLRARGGEVVCGSRVAQIVVRRNRAVAVRTVGGTEHPARHAVLADTGAPQLYRSLIDSDHVTDRLLADIGRFQYDNSTVKVDWALRRPIPWTADAARGAGTVHVAEGVRELAATSEQLVSRLIPARPFLIMGQYATADPSRSPEGADTAWAYTHVPQQVGGDAGGDLTGTWDEREVEKFADRIEERVERLAPGFRGLIEGRHIFGPRELEAANANLVGGAINGGTAQAHQQLIFRPTPGHLGRPETPIGGLYLASASAHPGGGVHGGPGANAARVAVAHRRARRATFGLSSIAAAAAMRSLY
jgi:phytoene dehydrogenase-like protein